MIFNGILDRNPVPVTQLSPASPPKLQEIIAELLEKDRDLRCQTAAELRGDLRRLKRDLESGRSAVAESKDASAVTRATSSSVVAVAPSSSQVIAAARQHKFGLALGTFIGLVVIAAAGYGIYALVSRGHGAAFSNISMTKVTDTGISTEVAISPDGKYLLHVTDSGGQQSLWLRNIPTNSNAEVVAPVAQVRYNFLQFSPDGNFIYFARTESGNFAYRHLYRVAVLGGTPEKLVSDIDSNVTFSPDGRQFAYLVWHDPGGGQIPAGHPLGGNRK